MEFKVQFDVFEGPMDLLLYLVKKQEVDIYQVNLTRLATDFIQYVEFMRELDLEVAGEFVVMAATLMYIKSKELLPKDRQVVADDEEEEEDPRWELIRQLIEYRKFKDAAARLKDREIEQESVFTRVARKPDLRRLEPVRVHPDTSVLDLVGAVGAILERIREKEASTREIHADAWSVSQKIAMIRERATRQTRFRFSELFHEELPRQEVVVTFLAILEMTRMKILRVIQSEPFAEIEIEVLTEEERAAAEAVRDEAEPSDAAGTAEEAS